VDQEPETRQGEDRRDVSVCMHRKKFQGTEVSPLVDF